MSQQSYNFFGLGPGQMAPGQDPATLAQAMALKEYLNPTSSQASASSSPGIDTAALAKMMMQPTQSSMGVGSGLTPQFAQGLANPDASTAMGSGLSQPFGQDLMGGAQQSPYNLNGVWNG